MLRECARRECVHQVRPRCVDWQRAAECRRELRAQRHVSQHSVRVAGQGDLCHGASEGECSVALRYILNAVSWFVFAILSQSAQHTPPLSASNKSRSVGVGQWRRRRRQRHRRSVAHALALALEQSRCRTRVAPAHASIATPPPPPPISLPVPPSARLILPPVVETAAPNRKTAAAAPAPLTLTLAGHHRHTVHQTQPCIHLFRRTCSRAYFETHTAHSASTPSVSAASRSAALGDAAKARAPACDGVCRRLRPGAATLSIAQSIACCGAP